MKLNEAIQFTTLTEGLSPVLFHAASLDKTLWILRNQMLRADSMGNISFSRSRTNAFTANMGDNMEGHDGVIVVIELDGRKLMANVRGRPVDSFAPAGRDFDNEYSRDPEFDYMEDRIILPKGQGNINIPRMGVYAFHFIINNGDDINLAAKIFNALSHTNKYVYETIRDFQQKKTVDPSVLKDSFRIMGESISSADDFAVLLSNIAGGMFSDPTDQDISNFVKAYNKWKNGDVKNEIRELVMVYNTNGVRITKPSELLTKSHLL